MGCYASSSSCWSRYVPSPLSKILVSILTGLSSIKSIRQNIMMKVSLSSLNTFWQNVVQMNNTFFFINSINDNIMSEYLLMNHRLKFPNPRNLWSSFRFLGFGQSSIFRIFSESILILLISTMNPRKSTSFLWNLYFSNLYLSCLTRNYSNIFLIYSRQFSRFSEQMSISSKYVIIQISKYSANILLINI